VETKSRKIFICVGRQRNECDVDRDRQSCCKSSIVVDKKQYVCDVSLIYNKNGNQRCTARCMLQNLVQTPRYIQEDRSTVATPIACRLFHDSTSRCAPLSNVCRTIEIASYKKTLCAFAVATTLSFYLDATPFGKYFSPLQLVSMATVLV